MQKGSAVVASVKRAIAAVRARVGGPRSAFPRSVPASSAGRPNVLLIVLDATRADHLSCYGYHRKTTPNIDAVAAAGRVYTDAMTPGTWTLESHASLFTGLPASAHGTNWTHQGLDGRFPTLAELLKSAGYQTVGLSANPNLTASRCFDRGFDFYQQVAPRWTRRHPPGLFHKLVLETLKPRHWLSATPRMHRRIGEWFRTAYRPDRPFFLFLNYLDAHQPYAPPLRRLRWCTPGARAKWENHDFVWDLFHYMLSGEDVLSSTDLAELETLYDEKIAYLDERIGELLAFLSATGLDRNMLVAITADHGEHFGEHHMMEHQYSVYEPLVRVPFILKWPGHVPTGVEDTLVQGHDLFPTILEAARVEWKRTPAHNCESLLHLSGHTSRVGISEYLVPYLPNISNWSIQCPHVDLGRFLRPLRAVRVGRLKLIQPVGGRAELYDLSKDPSETHDLAAEQPETVRELQSVLLDWLHSFEPYSPNAALPGGLGKLPAEVLERLRALGYA